MQFYGVHMSDKLLGSDINPKATVQAKTDMSENYELSDGFNPFDYIEKPKPENLEVSVGDALKAATTSGLRSVQGIFEIPNQINHSSTEKAYMQRVPEELRSEAKPTPFEDKRKSLSNIAVDKLGEWADSVQDTMSSDAQKAMHTPFYRDGEVSSDPAVWGIQFANLVGYMAPTVATMIATRKVPIDSLAPNIKSLMLRSGVSAEMAEKALPHTLNAIKNAPALGVGVASDVGSQGVQAREMLLNASHEQLMQSPTYIQAFRDIHADPENAGLSNEQKFELAKERVSNIASQDTMTDPKTIAASVLATGFGDVALSRAVLSGTAKSAGGLRGAATGFLKGGTKEGGLEFSQEYTTQRVSNEISNKHAGTNLDLDSGAMDAGINGLIGGFAMGGGMGAAGGLRSAQQTNQDMPEHNEASADTAKSNVAEASTDPNTVDVSATANLGDKAEAPADTAKSNEAEVNHSQSDHERPHVQWGYTKEEAVDDLDAPAYIREELRNQEGPQLQHEVSIDPNDLDTPAYMRQGKTINTEPNIEQPNQRGNLPVVSDIEGESAGESNVLNQQQQVQPEAIGDQQTRLKDKDIIYGDAPVRKPIGGHMEQQTSASQFNNGDQSIELQPAGDVKLQVVIDGEHYTVEHNGAGTQLVPSDAQPSVIYGRDTRPEQDTTIYDKQVGYPQFENGIPKKKLRQLKYLANRISEKVPLAMQKLKGAARFTRPEYRTRLVSLADEATSLGNSRTINTQIDSISDAITKLGGISRTIAESEGLDPAAFKRNRLFPATSGRSFDDLAESLNEYGYTNRSGGQLTANDVLDLVDGEVNSGERHFSAQSDMLSETEQGSALVDLVREYGAERVQAAIGKALTGGRLGDRQAEIVNEAMDVIETGRIEQAGGIEYRRAEREARREARIAKRKQQMDDTVMDLDIPSWVTDEVTAQTESEYNETIEAVLNTAVDHATAANPVVAEALLDQYEAGQITTASLIEQLGVLDYADQQKLRNVEKFKPATEGADYSSDASRIGEGQANSSAVNRGGNRSDGVSAEQSTEQSVGGVPENSARSYRKNEGAEVGNDNSTQKKLATDTQVNSSEKKINDMRSIDNNDTSLTNKPHKDNIDYSFDLVKAELDAGRGHLIPSEYLHRYSKEYKIRNNEKSVTAKKNVHFSKQGITPEAEHSGKGMPLKQAELAVKSWLRQYKGGAMVNVKAVQTQAEAEQILGVSLDGYKVNAFYNEVDATVVVVADNIANTKELRQKLRHEILVHHGLRAVTGDAEYKRVLMTVYTGLESRFLKDLIKQVETDYSRGNLNNFVEEVLAHVAEQDRNKVQKWLDRVVASIAQALRKVGLLAPSDMTKAELRNIVETLSDRIKSVNEWSPDNTPPPSGNGVKGHLSRTKFSRTSNTDNKSSFQADAEQAWARLAARMSGPIADTADGGFDIPTDNIKSTFIRKFADKFQILKELQKNIAKSGGKITEENDAYLAEELFHGRAETDLRKMKDTFIKPLADKMAQHGISQAQLDEYLIARHAQERNAYIAKINPKFPDGGSGMKNADAQAKLDEIKNSGKQQKYDELAHIVDAMIAKQRDVLRDSGLETDEMIDTWQSHYKHYVPLKGIAKDESSLPHTGKGFSIGGKEARNAMGRKSMAESPSSHAIIDLTEKIIRAQKNQVGNTLLKLIQDNPSPDYWQIFTNENPDTAPQRIERKNPVTGEKETIVVDRHVPMAMMPDHYFATKKDGKIYYIKLHDQRLMKAMRNMGPDTSNGVIRFMAGFNRILAIVNTSYNPEFVIGNFPRDIQTAILNLSAEQTRDDGKIKGEAIVKQTIKDIKKAIPAIYASLRNKTSKSPKIQEWQRHFEEFMEVGGKTGWFDMKDVDGQAKELDRMVAMANGSITGKAYKAFENVTGFVENINGTIENAVRLSAYVNARKAGISKKKAASLAKNMTVNFNRRGEVGTTLNAMYMFANASIQSSANFVRTMGSLNGDGKLKWQNLNTAQKIAIGIVAGSFALAFANRSAAGEDDDGVNWFDKVPSYVKERNFVIMKSLLGGKADGTYWSIPMPYGYNIFSVAGSGIEAAVNSDNVTPAQVAGNMALAMLGAFSPIGMSESKTVSGTILKNAAPTIAKPFVEVGLNENFHGGQIYKENMPFGTQLPDSSLSKLSTSEHYKAIASWLNKVTGGSAYRSKGIDISPDVMQYIVGYFGGAALRFADVKVPGLVQRVTGDEIEDSQVAFLSRISGRVMPYEDQKTFYNRRDELMQIRDEIKTINGSDRSAYMKDYGYKLRLLPMLKMTEKQLKALRKRRDAIYALDMPRAQKDLRLKSIERQMKKVIDRFNLRYTQLKGAQLLTEGAITPSVKTMVLIVHQLILWNLRKFRYLPISTICNRQQFIDSKYVSFFQQGRERTLTYNERIIRDEFRFYWLPIFE